MGKPCFRFCTSSSRTRPLYSASRQPHGWLRDNSPSVEYRQIEISTKDSVTTPHSGEHTYPCQRNGGRQFGQYKGDQLPGRKKIRNDEKPTLGAQGRESNSLVGPFGEYNGGANIIWAANYCGGSMLEKKMQMLLPQRRPVQCLLARGLGIFQRLRRVLLGLPLGAILNDRGKDSACNYRALPKIKIWGHCGFRVVKWKPTVFAEEWEGMWGIPT